MQLRDGSTTKDPRLDRLYELDYRSLNYRVGEQVPEAIYRSRSWDVGTWLDQGSEGACVGFAFSHDLIADPVRVLGVNDYYALGVYHDAQRIDEWPGGSYPGASPFYEGTSILAGAKTCHNRGFYSSYSWAITLEELVRGLSNFGPCVLGVNWYDGMYDTDNNGFIHPSGRITGGHAILISGVVMREKTAPRSSSKPKSLWQRIVEFFHMLFSTAPAPKPTPVPVPEPTPEPGPTPEPMQWDDYDLDASYVTLWNSWGNSWGVDGTAKISLRNLGRLLVEQGDACFPVRTELTSVS